MFPPVDILQGLQFSRIFLGSVGAASEHGGEFKSDLKRVARNTSLAVLAFPVQYVCNHLYPPAVFSRSLFHLSVLPLLGPWLETILGFLIFDFFAYWLHRLEHRAPWLWKLHSLHHSDAVLDMSTHLRKHPVSYFYTVPYFLAVQVVFQIPLASGIAFVVALDFIGLMNHTHAPLSPAWDRLLRVCGIVSQSDHRIHHSRVVTDANSNYGMTTSLWDRLFGTYRSRPSQIPIQFGI